MDVIMSFPGIALAAVFVSVFGNSLPSITFAIGFLYIPQIARVVRANVVSEYGNDYVRAVIVSGARAPWILAKHVMRNCIAPIMVYVIVLVADAIVFEASLSFISAGIQEPTPTWGNILSDARAGVLAGRWWQAMFPGLAIMVTVLCLNILSEGVTDAMVAAPSAPVEDDGKNAAREADRLVADPVAAYKAQAASLNASLGQLEAVEEKRTDRHVADDSVKPLLEVKDLCIKFPRHGDVNVVDHVSFDVRPGQTMGLVGESGCGKSITSLTIMGLIDRRAQITGEILYEGRNLLDMTDKQRNDLRGHEMAMVYQDALSSLNPSMLIKNQMKQLTDRGGTRSAEELLTLVGLDPKRTLESYPHELSGGQRQRVLIAMALTRDPKLVICDEPTTALDVTVQKQVIKLLNDLQAKLGFAMLFVSHDLALVAEVAHTITVMYAGQVVEQAPTKELLCDPIHEYTRGLLGSVISIEGGMGRLHQVPGTVPSPKDFNDGDRFAPRSSHPTVGLDIRPVLKEVPGTSHYYAELPDADLVAAGLTPHTEGGAR
jgi:peptide/nickel transport system permease protein